MRTSASIGVNWTPNKSGLWRPVCRQVGAAASADELTGRMFAAMNGMLLDMLAAVATQEL